MRYGRAATACAALALPVTVLLGGAVAWFYKARNPDDVDITAGPACLRPILLTTFGTFLVMAILTIALAVLGLRRGAARRRPGTGPPGAGAARGRHRVRLAGRHRQQSRR